MAMPLDRTRRKYACCESCKTVIRLASLRYHCNLTFTHHSTFFPVPSQRTHTTAQSSHKPNPSSSSTLPLPNDSSPSPAPDPHHHAVNCFFVLRGIDLAATVLAALWQEEEAMHDLCSCTNTAATWPDRTWVFHPFRLAGENLTSNFLFMTFFVLLPAFWGLLCTCVWRRKSRPGSDQDITFFQSSNPDRDTVAK